MNCDSAYHFRSVNKRECTTIYKVNQKEQQDINNKKNIYDQGILDEFYNIIRMKYIKSVQHCIDNNMGTNCETPNISIEDWSNIIENNKDIKEGFEEEIMDAYKYRLNKCLNDPTIICGEEEMNRIIEQLPSNYILNEFKYRYTMCLINNNDIVCPEDEQTYLQNYINEN